MSHASNDDTLINTKLRQVLRSNDKSSQGNLENKELDQDRQSRHSEPTVELNHPIESGIVPNIDDHFDNNSETEEIIFPFGSDPEIDLDGASFDSFYD